MKGTCNNCRWVEIFFPDNTMETNGVCYHPDIEDRLIKLNRHDCPYWEDKYETEDE